MTRIAKEGRYFLARTFKLFFVLCIVTLTGCNGGLIGTSTGPTESDTRIVVLPKKVGPRVPDSLVTAANESNTNIENLAPSNVLNSSVSQEALARSWQILSPTFLDTEATRIAVELELMLLESVYTTIVERCGSLTLEPCEFARGELDATYTQDVYDSYVNSESQSSNVGLRENLARLMAQENIFVGDQIEFGRVSLNRLNDDVYAFRVNVDSLSFLSDKAVQLDWSSDFSDIRYSTQTNNALSADAFHYQTLPDAQRLTINSASQGWSSSNVVSLELTTGSHLGSSRFLFNANVAGDTIAGHAIDASAYTVFFDYGDEGTDAVYLQEKFNAGGEITDSLSCNFENFESACLSSELLGSSVTFSGQDFERAIAQFGFYEVAVSNLPDDVGRFEIQSPASSSPGSPATYCDVWQPPEVLYETVICYEDPDIVLNGVVVAIDSDGNEFVVDDAEIALDSGASGPSAAELAESSIRGEKYVGTFELSCSFDDFEPEESNYIITTATFTEDTITLKDEIFEDASCSIPASPSETVSTGNVYYPGGAQETPLGSADFINISLTGLTQDGSPLSNEDQQLITAAGFFDLVIYSIILIDGDELYIGDSTEGDVGLSAALRSTTLDTLAIIRQ